MLNRTASFIFAILFVLVASLPAAAQSDIPSDTPENFLKRYERYIDKKEYKSIEKINKRLDKLKKQPVIAGSEKETLLQQRDQLISDFWTNHYPDPDPSTPENERKQLIDERIDKIAQEIFFLNFETPGLLFRNNDGFHGDMAWVYLLHGSPLDDGNSGFISMMPANGIFTDMMLWFYGDLENNDVRFVFLFYRRNGGGPFQLFPQDIYQDSCEAVNEIMLRRTHSYYGCTSDIENAFNQFRYATAQDGTPVGLYFWALTNFSTDSSIRQGLALEPPLHASVVAKKSPSRVTGEAETLSAEEISSYILATCEGCNSMIPARLYRDSLTIYIENKNLDWAVVGDKIKTELKIRTIIESLDNKKFKPIFIESGLMDVIEKNSLEDGNIVILLGSFISNLHPGNYTISIYIKNILTNNSGKDISNKYNAWLVEFSKK